MTSTSATLRPTCHSCGEFLEIHPGQTAEQRFCGTWYDHPRTSPSLVGHTGTVLLPSVELTDFLEGMAVGA